MGHTTHTDTSQKIGSLWNELALNREAVAIQRRGQQPDVATLPDDELSILMETTHLLRSPANALRLLNALRRARSGKGLAMSVEELRKNSRIDEAGR